MQPQRNRSGVKRPKIQSMSYTPSGDVKSKRIPLASPFTLCSTPKSFAHHEENMELNPTLPYFDQTNHHEQFLSTPQNDVKTWKQIRPLLQHVYYESCVPDVVSCSVCDILAQNDFVRCKDCGPFTFFCGKDCCDIGHRKTTQTHLFHKPELWTVNGYMEYNMDIFLARPDHQCTTTKSRSGLHVFDDKGRIHQCTLIRCDCEQDESITLIRHNLWAASTKEPKVAFHFELMKWIEFLILEASLSLQAACLAIRWKNGFADWQYNMLYRHLVGEPIEEFLYFSYSLRELISEDDISDGTQCPACPQNDGKMFVCLDANFGLVRKVNAGQGKCIPRHEQRLFAAQDHVDEFVDSRQDKVPPSKDCNTFQAGSAIRAKNKTVKLDQKAVFGAACRHGIPILMMSMKDGERLAYPIYALNALLNKVTGTKVNLHVLYDIACLLDSHLKKNNEAELYKDITLAVPIFHAYGHRSSCQIQYSCRWIEGFALTDGEAMERLWSYLRRFANSTKEMTASNRIDRLTDALLHYSRKKRHEMDALLCRNMEKAQYMITCTSSELSQIENSRNVNESYIKEWLCSEKARAKADTGKKKKKTGTSVSETNRGEMLSQLRSQAMEYAFLAMLRKKYSSGQSIAKRICRSIYKTTGNMKTLLAKYNDEIDGNPLEWKDICTPGSVVYNRLDQDHSDDMYHLKQKALDVYLHKLRATEEVQQTKDEMVSTLQWYAQEHAKLSRLVQKEQSRGLLDALHKKRKFTAKAFCRARVLFSGHLDGHLLPTLDIDLPPLETDDLDSASTLNEVVVEEDLHEDSDYDEEDIS